jgi:biopolymer transport protein ExbD
MGFSVKPGGEEELAENGEINVTPFIDVILVLLIIFMVAAPISTVDIPVDLPAAAAQPNPKPEKPVYVTMKADLSLAIGETAIARDALGAAIAAATGGKKETRLFLRADKSVPYGEIMRLFTALRAEGYLKIAMVALEQGGAPAAAP